MKRFLLLLSLPLILGLSTWAFMEGRKEMQKERDREKPVQTPPRVKKTSDGSVIIEFDKATYSYAHATKGDDYLWNPLFTCGWCPSFFWWHFSTGI